MKLDAKQLRVTRPSEEQLNKIQRKPIYIVLDNVLDTYNIGSIFRLADAVAAKEVILCGQTETPPSSRIHKAAVGTEEWVKWRYFADTKSAIEHLKIESGKLKVIAVEQDSRAVPLFYLTHSAGSPLSTIVERGGGEVVIVVGHETEGVSKEVLDMVDVIVEIPMYGVNKSLNVHVSAAIVAYGIIKPENN
jgi:tRNA G18 (ribose-2'-O)-methylase SpoU